MDVKERSLTFSETIVIAAVDIMLPTDEGIVSKLVLMVLKPRLRKEMVRYDPGGLEGIPKSIPLFSFGQSSVLLWGK